MAVVSYSVSDESFDNACKIVYQTLCIEGLHGVQVSSIKELLQGKNVFVNLPTGSGKSLIFQSFPLVVDCLHVRGTYQQVNYLQDKGIKAAFLGEEQLDEFVKGSVEKGKFRSYTAHPKRF